MDNGHLSAQAFERREAPDLEPGELIRIRALIYRVAGFNAYGQAMLVQIKHPNDGEKARGTEGFGVRGL